MKKILVIGSLNMDMIARVAKVPIEGETILGSDLIYIPGGKGANQATAIGKLGGDVTMLGVVGYDNYGDSLIETLKNNNVNVDHVSRTEKKSTGLAFIMINSEGNNSIIVMPNANDEVCIKLIDEVNIAEYDIIVAQMEIPVEVIKYAFSRAKKAGLYTILNPAPAQELQEELLRNVDLIIPNETEFEILTGYSSDKEEELHKGIRQLKDSGVREVIITLGEKGVRYYDEANNQTKVASYKVKSVDTTAAGDCFIGALAASLSKNSTMLDSLDFAVKAAAITVGTIGAQVSIPTLQMVNKFKGSKNI